MRYRLAGNCGTYTGTCDYFIRHGVVALKGGFPLYTRAYKSFAVIGWLGEVTTRLITIPYVVGHG